MRGISQYNDTVFPLGSTMAGAVLDIRENGAIGTDDDTAVVQAALNAGLAWWVPSTLNIKSTLTLQSGSFLNLSPNAVLNWVGAAGGTMFTGGASSPLVRAGVAGIGGMATIVPVSASNNNLAYVFDLHSAQACLIDNIRCFGATSGGSPTFLRLTPDSASTAGSIGGNNNCSQSLYRNVICGLNFGRVLDLNGVQAGSVVTLNTFDSFHGLGVKDRAVRFNNWTDSNTLTGNHRYALTASNAIGVIWNDSATPSVESNCYDNTVNGALYVDTFAGGQTGRIALSLNFARGIVVETFANNPAAEGGIVLDNYPAAAFDYFVREINAPTHSGFIYEHRKNIGTGL